MKDSVSSGIVGESLLEHFLADATAQLLSAQRPGRDRRIVPTITAAELRVYLAKEYGDFTRALPGNRLVGDVARMLRDWNLDITHPRYFGLFNPPVQPASVAADLLVAGFNPQLAVWTHAPAANEIERHTLRYLAGRLGLDPDSTAAYFTSGGAEANQSALVVALTHGLPEFRNNGLRGITEQPVIYVTSESHHSVVKAAHMSGLGRNAVQTVGVDADLKLDISSLRRAIKRDRARRWRPFLVVGTAGTTGAGIIDPLPELAELCETEGLWLHIDAAWGGAACLSPRLRPELAGIERADSVTWDAHKWLSVPMGGGMFFCTHCKSVRRTFDVETGYMPSHAEDTLDPYASTIQWSRRHIGLKVFMSLAALGADGYSQAIEHQTEQGDQLRDELQRRGWRIVNNTRLPVVCFTRPELESGAVAADQVVMGLSDRNFWISSVRLGNTPSAVLRACVTSYETTAEDTVALADAVTDVLTTMRP